MHGQSSNLDNKTGHFETEISLCVIKALWYVYKRESNIKAITKEIRVILVIIIAGQIDQRAEPEQQELLE